MRWAKETVAMSWSQKLGQKQTRGAYMRRWYPDQWDKKQYADCGSLLATAGAIYTGKRTEKYDGLGLLDSEIEGNGCRYQQEEGVEICL